MFSRVLANLRGRHRRFPPEADGVQPQGTVVRYLFEAIVTVPLADWEQFDKANGGQAAQKLVRLHADVGLIIKHSTFNLERGKMTFYNYWSMGADANTLAQAELKLSDDVFYATFDQRVQRTEIKNIVVDAVAAGLFPRARASMEDGIAALKKLSQDNPRYLRLIYNVKRTKLSEFVARLESGVETFGLRHGWLLGNSFLYLSGREGQVVQLWLLPEQSHASPLEKTLDKMPWLRDADGLLVEKRPAPQLLMPSPFDPVMSQVQAEIKPKRKEPDTQPRI
jgi:hypothetical protein